VRGGVDLRGQTFGRLTALERAGSDGKNARWRCRCECGGECLVGTHLLRQGYTKSCGCLRRESAASNGRSENSRRAAAEQMRRRYGPRPDPQRSPLDDLAAAWASP